MWHEERSPRSVSDFAPGRAVRRRVESVSTGSGPRAASATSTPMGHTSIGHCRKDHGPKVNADRVGNAPLLRTNPSSVRSESVHLNLNLQQRPDPTIHPDPDLDPKVEPSGSHSNRHPHVVMAAFYQGPSLGLAVYDALVNEASILQCQDEVRGPLKFQMLQLAKLQVQPQLLLVSTKADETMMQVAQAPYDSEYGNEYDNEADGYRIDGGGGGRGFEVRMERSTAFTYDRALRRLGQLYLRPSASPTHGSIAGHSAGNGTQQPPMTHGSAGRPGGFASQTEGEALLTPVRNVLQIAGLVDLGQRQAVGALGALVGFLLREGLTSGAPDDLDRSRFRSINGRGVNLDPDPDVDPDRDPSTQGHGAVASGMEMLVVYRLSQLAVQGLLQVDLPTLYGLQILASERHPSAMGLGKPKEGFSLFSLANRCVTQMGRRLLRMWFLRPLVNLDVIRDRQDTLELLLRNSGELIPAFRAELKKLPDMQSLLQRLALAQQRPDLKALQQLQSCLQQLLRLRAAFEQQLAPELATAAAAAMAGADGGGRAGEKEVDDGAAASESCWGRAAQTLVSSVRRHANGGQQNHGGSTRGQGHAANTRQGLLCWDAVLISSKVLNHVGTELQTALDTLMSLLDTHQAEDDMVIAAGVCPELDQLKTTYRCLPEHLSQVVASELRRVPRYVARQNMGHLWSVLYLPQVGFVMRVQGQQLTADVLDALPDYELAFEGSAGFEEECGGGTDDGGGVDSLTHGSGSGVSKNGHANWAAFYRTAATRELNDRFGDLQYRIQDLEATLVAEMVGRILRHFGPRLQRAAAAAAELDCLVALAALAADGGPGGAPYCRPQLTTDNMLSIVNGRHPLAEAVVETYIPFTTTMHQDRARLQVVTGPNASGKSCYARAVALIVFLAHLGSYVPADSATIGLADRIAARSTACAAAAVALPTALPSGVLAGGGGGGGGGRGGGVRPSTFMADMAQVSSMLRCATSRTLLVLDEFGKGTLASDGGGLTASLLNHFATGITEPPIAAASEGAMGELPEPSWDGNTDPWVSDAAVQPPALPPRLILCTHFHEIFRPGILSPSPQLAFLQMEVLSEPRVVTTHGSAADGTPGSRSGRPLQPPPPRHPPHLQQQQQAVGMDEHVFLYRLVSGQCSASFGVHCARLAGLDEAVCRRALEIISAQQSGGVVSRSSRALSSPQVLLSIRRLRQLQASSTLDGPDRDAALRRLLQREVEESEAAAAAGG